MESNGLKVSSHCILLYQAITTRTIKVLAVLEQCSVLIEKHDGQLFYITGYCEHVIRFSPKVISNN